MKVFINYALKRELYNARKNQVLHCIIGLTELGLDHKEAIRLAYSLGCDLNDNFTEQMHACFERQSAADFNENGYRLCGFFWERVL